MLSKIIKEIKRQIVLNRRCYRVLVAGFQHEFCTGITQRVIAPLLFLCPSKITQKIVFSLVLDNWVPGGSNRAVKLLTSSRLLVVLEEVLYYSDYKFQASKDTPAVIFDCGANIGIATLFFKIKYPNSCVVCFEPISENCAFLRDLVKKNKWGDTVTVVEAAVGVEGGKQRFHASARDPLGGSLTERKFESDNSLYTIDVDVVRLKEYLEKFEKITFLKVDIEGSEEAVIADIGDCHDKISYMFIEVHMGKGIDAASFGKIICEISSDFYFSIQPNHTFRGWKTCYDSVALEDKSHCIYARNRGLVLRQQ